MKYPFILLTSTILISLTLIIAYDTTNHKIPTRPERPIISPSVYATPQKTGTVADMRTDYGIESQSHQEAFVAAEDTPPQHSEARVFENFPAESYQEQVEDLR